MLATVPNASGKVSQIAQWLAFDFRTLLVLAVLATASFWLLNAAVPVMPIETADSEAYVEFSSVPWRTGTLSPKTKELIYISFDCAATHLYVKGLKLHIENAVGYGATANEILEVMELASVIGIHAVTSKAGRITLALLTES